MNTIWFYPLFFRDNFVLLSIGMDDLLRWLISSLIYIYKIKDIIVHAHVNGSF